LRSSFSNLACSSASATSAACAAFNSLIASNCACSAPKAVESFFSAAALSAAAISSLTFCWSATCCFLPAASFCLNSSATLNFFSSYA